MVSPVRYLSRRQQNTQVGILSSASYDANNDVVLEVIGGVGIGRTKFDLTNVTPDPYENVLLDVRGWAVFEKIRVFELAVFQFDEDLEITGQLIIGTVTFSAAVGLFFGIWPARRAANMDPAVALRYE